MTKRKSLLDARSEQELEELDTRGEQVSSQTPTSTKGRGPIEGFLSVEEALNVIQVSERTLKTYLRDGKIKASKFGGKWRIRPEAIKAFMNGGEQ